MNIQWSHSTRIILIFIVENLKMLKKEWAKQNEDILNNIKTLVSKKKDDKKDHV